MATFPYTPGFVHGEDASFKVKVFRFDDDTEQRYLESRQRGLSLTYQWLAPDSGLVQSVTSFYQTYFNQAFEVVDHRTGAVHLARFAGDTFQHLRTVAQKREMRLQFVTVQDTQTEPVVNSWEPLPNPNCFVLSFVAANSPGFGTDPTSGDGPAVDSGTIVMSGNSIPGSQGADISFWRLASHSVVQSTWYTSLYFAHGTIGGGGIAFTRNQIYAVPFMCERSGTTLDAMGIHIKAGTSVAETAAKVAIYEARSIDNFDMVPGSIALNVGCVATNSPGWSFAATSYAFKSGRLYYLAFIHSSAPAFTLGHYGATTNAAVIGLQTDFDSGFSFTASYAVGNAFPDQFPTSMSLSGDNVPFIGLKFQK